MIQTTGPMTDEALGAGWPGGVESMLGEAAVHAGALIDGVCCRFGDWVDWDRYRPLFSFRTGPDEGPVSAITLALAGNDHGLRAGGFIEMQVLPRQKRVEANGGYYDEYNQPRPVIEGSFGWQDLTQELLGQALLLMYDRIVKAYGERNARIDEVHDADRRHRARAGIARPGRGGRLRRVASDPGRAQEGGRDGRVSHLREGGHSYD